MVNNYLVISIMLITEFILKLYVTFENVNTSLIFSLSTFLINNLKMIPVAAHIVNRLLVMKA